MGSYQVGIKEIVLAGGFTLGILSLLSIYTAAVVWERWRFYKKALGSMPRLMTRLKRLMAEENLKDAVGACRSHPGAISTAVLAVLTGPTSKAERRSATDRAIDRQVAGLERRLAALGTIGSTAPFIGLFGTVLGVMRAFRDLAGAANAGPGVVAIGISEALVATAAGLFVAIPAIVAYNYFTTRANSFSDEARWITDELLEKLTQKQT